MPDLIRSAVLGGVPELIAKLGADPGPVLLQLALNLVISKIPIA